SDLGVCVIFHRVIGPDGYFAFPAVSLDNLPGHAVEIPYDEIRPDPVSSGKGKSSIRRYDIVNILFFHKIEGKIRTDIAPADNQCVHFSILFSRITDGGQRRPGNRRCWL